MLLAHRTVSPTILATALALATVAGTTASASSSVPSHTPVAVNHAGERFAYASTYKALAAAEALRQESPDQLNHVVQYSEDDLVSYSPITSQHVDTGMTVRELCDAAVRYSDNTAGNLLLRQLGGPAGLGRALARLGDHTTHVNRYEPDLNTAVPGDVRDTTSPRALGNDLEKYAVGGVLTKSRRDVLDQWLRGNTTGGTLIRSGLPRDWTVGDKSGAGSYGTRNDIAVAWRPNRAPLVLVVMSSRHTQDAPYDDALVAEAARVAAESLP
ncbi:class A beta-lactamase [Streptomyces sp. MK7]|uniref:class A beta-lactamase n=1 Tax=Streptomyces sp. MK7 TaxID=3067635 RepID=UPI002931F403|nr:class A beta-lactamase [Streptomyces sp. MK7]